MKAVKRPIPIEVVQFTLAAPPACVQARADGSHFVWNELHQSEINIKPGDYLNVTSPGDIYPIEEAVFASTYVVHDEPPDLALTALQVAEAITR